MNKTIFPEDLTTLIGLVSNYSPSGSERTAVKFMVDRANALGYDNNSIDQAGNAVCVMGNGPKQVILLGHIDTVPGEIPIRIEEDQLYGRGSVDAKGPLACFLDAVAAVGPIEGWQFIVIGAVEEERNSEGARFISNEYSPEFAIIGEPNHWDRIGLGYKGSATAKITVTRTLTHSAHDQQSAAEIAIDYWNLIKNFTQNFNAEKQKMFEQFLPSVHEMSASDNGFNQLANITINTRLPLAFSPSAWYEKLTELCPEAEIEPLGFAIPAYACEKNSALVRAFLVGIRMLGGNPGFVYKSGTADLNIVAPHWGCPALVYGPGDSAFDHTPNEHISVQEFRQAVTVLTESLKVLVKHY